MIKWAERAIAKGQRCSCCGYEKAVDIIRYPIAGKVCWTITCEECASYLKQRYGAELIEQGEQ